MSSNKTYFSGVHQLSYTDSGKVFIKNGVTLYKVVVPDNINNDIALARDEFVHFFKIATDINIEVISDRNLTFNKDDKYISIGQTSILATSGLRIDYNELTKDGCRIMTKGAVVCLVGGSDIGTINAVYDFLHIVFRFEVYSPDVYEIDRNVKNLTLFNFDVKDIPETADIKLENQNKTISWRRIARAIEKNDFYLRRLSYAQTKTDDEKLQRLIHKWDNLLNSTSKTK